MTKIVNIMPMAGLGKRFFKNNFSLPKPLILIKKKPMFIQAAKSMPKSNCNIFICNKKLVKKYKIKEILKNEYQNNFKLITISRTTQGQASTCLLAKKYINKNDKIFIHSCDSLIKYDSKKLFKNLNNSQAIIFSTKPNKTHIQNIKSYGWINLKNNKINRISCKSKASNYPKKDFVIIGTFAFNNANIFLKLTKELIKNKQKINNEYYMDMVFKIALEKKIKIKNKLVDSYYSWGTPGELKIWKKKYENIKN